MRRNYYIKAWKLIRFCHLEDYGVDHQLVQNVFVYENYIIKNDRVGLLTNWQSQNQQQCCIITFRPAEWLDKKSVGFNEVIYGLENLRSIEKLGGLSGVLKKSVEIKSSGLVYEKEPNILDLQSHH